MIIVLSQQYFDLCALDQLVHHLAYSTTIFLPWKLVNAPVNKKLLLQLPLRSFLPEEEELMLLPAEVSVLELIRPETLNLPETL
jgi:hypothetical protein